VGENQKFDFQTSQLCHENHGELPIAEIPASERLKKLTPVESSARILMSLELKIKKNSQNSSIFNKKSATNFVPKPTFIVH
jgi:hypothetical protein